MPQDCTQWVFPRTFDVILQLQPSSQGHPALGPSLGLASMRGSGSAASCWAGTWTSRLRAVFALLLSDPRPLVCWAVRAPRGTWRTTGDNEHGAHRLASGYVCPASVITPLIVLDRAWPCVSLGPALWPGESRSLPCLWEGGSHWAAVRTVWGDLQVRRAARRTAASSAAPQPNPPRGSSQIVPS